MVIDSRLYILSNENFLLKNKIKYCGADIIREHTQIQFFQLSDFFGSFASPFYFNKTSAQVENCFSKIVMPNIDMVID